MENHVLRKFRFLVPAYLWEELDSKCERISRLTQLSEEEVAYVLSIIRSQTIVIPENVVFQGVDGAKKICPDPKDVPYVALALALNVPLLTGDRKLSESVKYHIKVYTPREVLDILEGRAGL
jgi:predicted nucleic acid-binding protein